MIIEVKRQNLTGSAALPGVVYIDGQKYAYSLENQNYKIPSGSYDLYLQDSPKFGKVKLYVKVSGRDGILFHGGNTAEDTKGCILIGSSRPDSEQIQGDKSDELAALVLSKAKAGEGVVLKVRDQLSPYILTAAAGIVAIILLSRTI